MFVIVKAVDCCGFAVVCCRSGAGVRNKADGAGIAATLYPYRS